MRRGEAVVYGRAKTQTGDRQLLVGKSRVGELGRDDVVEEGLHVGLTPPDVA